MTKPLRAPAGLGTAGRALWRQIATDWAENAVIPDAREHRLLADACHEADVLALLQAELDTAAASGSLTTRGSMGQLITHPHVAEARRSRAQIAANLRQIQLDVPEAKADGPKYRSRSEQARAAANARWSARG
ncbi:hypothetical protein [Microbacterium capsulatum]|uniref:Uncharacterized protein n=1 Tax=Microbacterium capsulatum TaxID=3041921 RepID=A0ABU0XDS9_9MICO|nr:hypothetical protein [Microbacterium sp. ASV81]MDQ4213267.1 hypothetical protein [Microbacterium sp. ASV81]